MDLLGYAALGGLERLTIVAGAVIIGYWGYRLYTAEKNAGLVFMGLAVVVLVGALATGGSYLKSIGEGYQLASLPADSVEADSPFTESTEPAVIAAPAEPMASLDEAVAMPAEPTAPAAPEPIARAAAEMSMADPSAGEAPVGEASAVGVAAAELPGADVPAAESAAAPGEAVEPTADDPPRRLATGAELGGRIVSVKSENVSLEWSSDADGSGSE